MKSVSLLFCLVLASCASKAPNMLESKFKRVVFEQDSYEKPQFFYAELSNIRASRSIASVAENSLSNKEAYFLGMYKQKIKMEKVLGLSQSNKNYCPAFHNHLLNYKKKLKAASESFSLSKDWKSLADSAQVLSNPMLALPVDSETDLLTYIREESYVDTETVRETFENYYKITKKEVKDLCETGASEGYFVFRNYSKYYSSDRSFNRSEDALKALLKVTPVTNYYLLDSIKVGGASGPDYFERQMFNKLNAQWFKGYVDRLKQPNKNISYIKD
ncbi:MAG: hypothetical protein CME64_15815 [Halobacteriovoraceae bacterium]|nr:hypothetical protein [Halobacteriovoraceae bacterium]